MRRSSAAPDRRASSYPTIAPQSHDRGAVSLLSDQAYELVKRDIIQCRLPPGIEVSEAALTKLYGFGKAPIRAALLRLSQDNLINSMPRRGYVVSPITIRNIQEVYGLRIIIEPAAARLATGRCNIPALTSLCERIRTSRSSSNKLDFLEAHWEFHVAIAKATGNHRITCLISSLLQDMARIIHFGEFAPGRSTESPESEAGMPEERHEAIVESLASGEADVVEKVMREHVEQSLAMVKEAAFASKSLVRL